VTEVHGVGEKVREARKRRGMSQHELSQSSGLSLSLIRKLEQGEREDVRVETLHKLAVALGVRTTSLLPDPHDGQPDTSTDSLWAPLREALTAPGSGEEEPGNLDETERALAGAVRLYHDNRYVELSVILPALLSGMDSAPPLLRSRVLQLAGSLLVQTGQQDTARVALERSLADAEASGSELDAASCVITQCWLMLRERQFETVERLAADWADRVEPRLSVASRVELSTWGWLLLRLSAAAIRDNRPDEAAEAMRLAQAAAAALPPKRQEAYHSYWTTFGSATVAMKRVENAVVDGHPDVALSLAEKVPAGLRPTSDNRNRHLLDIAAAHLSLREYAASFDVLHRLSREAPAWLVSQRTASGLLGQIISHRRTLTPEMRELADTFNLPL
jgi:transcriptional regulator with XRE-family HTH domain